MMTMATTSATLLIDSDLKQRAETMLDDFGLDINDVVASLLEQSIAAKGLPFDAKLPKMVTLESIKQSVGSVANKYNLTKVDLFGSYANGTATMLSDIDLIATFEQTPSLFKIAGLQTALQDLLMRKVDILTYPLANSDDFLIDKVVTVYERT